MKYCDYGTMTAKQARASGTRYVGTCPCWLGTTSKNRDNE
jgi:hypothetical protein